MRRFDSFSPGMERSIPGSTEFTENRCWNWCQIRSFWCSKSGERHDRLTGLHHGWAKGDAWPGPFYLGTRDSPVTWKSNLRFSSDAMIFARSKMLTANFWESQVLAGAGPRGDQKLGLKFRGPPWMASFQELPTRVSSLYLNRDEWST